MLFGVKLCGHNLNTSYRIDFRKEYRVSFLGWVKPES